LKEGRKDHVERRKEGQQDRRTERREEGRKEVRIGKEGRRFGVCTP
jgi:hypothetical protein